MVAWHLLVIFVYNQHLLALQWESCEDNTFLVAFQLEITAKAAHCGVVMMFPYFSPIKHSNCEPLHQANDITNTEVHCTCNVSLHMSKYKTLSVFSSNDMSYFFLSTHFSITEQ